MDHQELNTIIKQAEFEMEKEKDEVKKRMLANIRLVPWVIFRHFNNIPCTHDVFQHGAMGLLHASKNFKKDRNVKFSSYATWCIKGYIIRGFRQTKSIMFNNKMLSLLYPENVPEENNDEIGQDEIQLVLGQIDGRLKEILLRRFGIQRPRQTLEQIAQHLHLSRERIRQLEEMAKEQIRQKLKSQGKFEQLGELYG
jgi:RNA polymerase sigma factor (sigma-70 family)